MAAKKRPVVPVVPAVPVKLPRRPLARRRRPSGPLDVEERAELLTFLAQRLELSPIEVHLLDSRVARHVHPGAEGASVVLEVLLQYTDSPASVVSLVSKLPFILSVDADALASNLAALRSLGFSAPDFARTCRQAPRTLLASDEQLQAVVAVLAEHGIDAVRVLSKSSVISFPAATLRSKLAALRKVFPTPGLLARVVRQQPSVLTSNTEFKWRLMKRMLTDADVPEHRAEQALKRNPALLLQSLDTIQEKLDFFTNLGCTREDIGKIWSRADVFGLSLERTLRPAVRQLLSVGFKSEDMHKVAVRAPAIFLMSPAKFTEVLDVFQRYGIGGDDLRKTLERSGTLFTLSVSTLEGRLQQMRHAGFDDEQVVDMVSIMPRILTQHWDRTVQPKLDLILAHNYTTRDIAKCPIALAVSLQKRLRPRLHCVYGHGQLVKRPLSTICALPDHMFASQVAHMTPEQYRDFVATYTTPSVPATSSSGLEHVPSPQSTPS